MSSFPPDFVGVLTDKACDLLCGILVRHPLREVAKVYDFLGLQGFNQRVAGRIHARSVKRRSPPDIAPAVMSLCDELLARFRALPRQEPA
jgi:hypothetical protein